MKISVPKETRPGERRVALVPESCKKLIQSGATITVETDAGRAAGFGDDAYREVGATVMSDPVAVFGETDFIVKVDAPTLGDHGLRNEVLLMHPGANLLTGLMPLRNLAVVKALAAARITAFSTDAIPRTTRAQSMDTLSSMANITGYKGTLLAAVELTKYFPMLMTAAGTVFAAKVFVIGAGVAGLQAIATARRLGASVFATDVRPEVKEQIESVGAKYVGIDLGQTASAGGGYAKELSDENKARQRAMLEAQCQISDVVITTALIGGVIAPKLITAAMVRAMKPGSIIVDLGADGGGNCELSQLGSTVEIDGVKIIAPLNLPATVPHHASILWSRNVTNFINAFVKDGTFQLNLSDDIQNGCLITHEGQIHHTKTREASA